MSATFWAILAYKEPSAALASVDLPIAVSLASTLLARFPVAVFTSDILSAIFLSTEPSPSPFNIAIASLLASACCWAFCSAAKALFFSTKTALATEPTTVSAPFNFTIAAALASATFLISASLPSALVCSADIWPANAVLSASFR